MRTRSKVPVQPPGPPQLSVLAPQVLSSPPSPARRAATSTKKKGKKTASRSGPLASRGLPAPQLKRFARKLSQSAPRQSEQHAKRCFFCVSRRHFAESSHALPGFRDTPQAPPNTVENNPTPRAIFGAARFDKFRQAPSWRLPSAKKKAVSGGSQLHSAPIQHLQAIILAPGKEPALEVTHPPSWSFFVW